MNASKRNDSPQFSFAKAYACHSHAAADLSRVILGRVFSFKKVEHELMCFKTGKSFVVWLLRSRTYGFMFKVVMCLLTGY